MTRAALVALPAADLRALARRAIRALHAGGHAAPATCDYLPPWLLAELVLSAARRAC